MTDTKKALQKLVDRWDDLVVALRQMDETAEAFKKNPADEVDLVWWRALESAVRAAYRYEEALETYNRLLEEPAEVEPRK
jgi:hypothetical protein